MKGCSSTRYQRFPGRERARIGIHALHIVVTGSLIFAGLGNVEENATTAFIITLIAASLGFCISILSLAHTCSAYPPLNDGNIKKKTPVQLVPQASNTSKHTVVDEEMGSVPSTLAERRMSPVMRDTSALAAPKIVSILTSLLSETKDASSVSAIEECIELCRGASALWDVPADAASEIASKVHVCQSPSILYISHEL